MRNEQAKKATIHALDLMIRHADKGPSGFWVEDHEGCGNPAVFPEFEEGLKRGRACPERTLFLPMECRHYVRRWAWQHKHGVLP